MVKSDSQTWKHDQLLLSVSFPVRDFVDFLDFVGFVSGSNMYGRIART